MGSEYVGPLPDSEKQQSVRKPQFVAPQINQNLDMHDEQEENVRTQLRPAASNTSQHNVSQHDNHFEEPSYREHVSGALTIHPSDAPNFRPAPALQQALTPFPYTTENQQQQYQPFQQYTPYQFYQAAPQPAQQPYYPAYPGQQLHPQGYNGQVQQAQAAPLPGYAPNYPGSYAYPGYPNYPAHPGYAYPYVWRPIPRPRRDTYLLVMAILSVIGSSIVVLGGLGSIIFLLLTSIVPAEKIPANQRLDVYVLFTAFAIAGLVGGSFGLYHSIRSLFKKPSAAFRLPWFWTFLILYIVLILIEAVLRNNGQAVTNIPSTILLIALAGLLPAITILALGVRRLHFSRETKWPTTWRRFTMAIVSGATSAIVLALILESVLTIIFARVLNANSSGLSLDNPDQPMPTDPRTIAFLFILVALIAPIVEETVKPLAVVSMIGRIESAAEAFILGMSCGVGFDLVETSGYIGSGYNNWLDIAIQRSSAGLLHGFGAAMTALGWYILTHPRVSKHRFLIGFGCIAYAMVQHAIWNGSFVLTLLPAPIGPYLADGTIGSGAFSFPAFLFVYVVETMLMLIFFIFITGWVRSRKTPPTNEAKQEQSTPAAGQRQTWQPASARV